MAAAPFVLLLTALATPVAAMTFAMGGAGDCAQRSCVLARGEIDSESADALKAFVQHNHLQQGALVVLDSGGGLVAQGLHLGAYIRKQGFSTHVQGPAGACASACVYVFLGGVERTVAEGAKLGVHQISQAAGVVSIGSSGSQTLLSQVAGHVLRMGATLDVLTLAVRVPPERIYWLTAAELVRFRLVTREPLRDAP
jgi:hypothetical protein